MESHSLHETSSTLHTTNTNNPKHLGQNGQKEATACAEHLASVFQHFPSQLSVMEEETINNDLNSPHQLAVPMKKIRINEVKNVIKYKKKKKKCSGLRLDNRKNSLNTFPKMSQSNNTNL
jgi:hypothetical protein